MYQAQERLYLARDERIVKEGDPDAYRLFVHKGGYVPFQLAERYGLTVPPLKSEEQVSPASEEGEQAARQAPPKTTARRQPPKTTHRSGPEQPPKGGG